MSDHADIVREALKRIVDQQWEEFCPEDGDSAPTDTLEARALAALDALVAERDEARRDYEEQREYADGQYRKALAAEAEVARLREALTYHQCEGPELPCPVCAALAKEDA